MRFTFRWKTSGGAVLAATTLAVGLAGYAVPAGAATAARNASPVAANAGFAAGNASAAARFASLAASGGVSAEAALGTPQLNKTGTSQEVIRQLVQCGSTMYAVGRFTQISQAGVVSIRNNVFSFSATAPYTITPWAPNVNGQVNAIAFNGSDCTHAYIGGKFTSINGTTVSNIAEIDATPTSKGNVVPGFGTNADSEVWTMVYANGHLLTGGDFIHVNGTKENHFASLNPLTGADDHFIQLNISGTYQYCAPGGKPCTDPNNRPQVYNQQLSHGGTLDLVEGRFTSVGGQPRQQVFMLNVAGTKATVTGWTSPEWDGSDTAHYPYFQCVTNQAFYIRTGAWSPDDSTVYLATTGYHPVLTNTNPRKGLCDSVTAWPATTGKVFHKWIEYSGCDSYYTVSADNAAVYAAGHPRWAENSNGCDQQGPGAIADAGLQGFSPADGSLELNTGGTALYTMTRANADNMLVTSAGLWIGSTNRYTVNKCGDLTGPPGHNAADHAGICFLPYPS
jgi:hypothetical protein